MLPHPSSLFSKKRRMGCVEIKWKTTLEGRSNLERIDAGVSELEVKIPRNLHLWLTNPTEVWGFVEEERLSFLCISMPLPLKSWLGRVLTLSQWPIVKAQRTSGGSNPQRPMPVSFLASYNIEHSTTISGSFRNATKRQGKGDSLSSFSVSMGCGVFSKNAEQRSWWGNWTASRPKLTSHHSTLWDVIGFEWSGEESSVCAQHQLWVCEGLLQTPEPGLHAKAITRSKISWALDCCN